MMEVHDNTGIVFDNLNILQGIQFTSEKELLKSESNIDGQFLKL